MDNLYKTYTLTETAARLRVSTRGLRRMRIANQIEPPIYIGRSPRYTEAQIELYWKQRNGSKGKK